MPDLAATAQHLLALRVGARLRGIEVTADGRVERRGADWVFCLSGSNEKVRLGPLAAKVQLDTRKNRPEAPSEAESRAWDRLRRDWRSPEVSLRVRGPIVQPSPETTPTLEVRACWFFSPVRPKAHALWLGLEVNGPYGLGEPWAVIREGLKRFGDWEWLTEIPDLETATFQARTSTGRWPEQAVLANQVGNLGAGATLRGMEAAVQGSFSVDDDRLVFRVIGCEDPIALAPLDRKIQRDGRRGSEAKKTAEERGAYDRLRAAAEKTPRRARVLGPVVESRAGRQWLLEVRGFDLEPGPGEPLAASTQDRREGRDSIVNRGAVPPAPPRSLSARFRDGQIQLSWDENSEPDLDGYNVFRTTTPGRGYIQMAAGIVPHRAAFRAEDGGVTYHYVVTARDKSGRESGFSSEATVLIPRPLLKH